MSTAARFPPPDRSGPGSVLWRAVQVLQDAAAEARAAITPAAFNCLRDTDAAELTVRLAGVADWRRPARWSGWDGSRTRACPRSRVT